MKFFIEKIVFPSDVSTLHADGKVVAKVKQRTGDVEVHYSIGVQDGQFIKTDIDEITGTFTLAEETYLENSKPDDLVLLIKKHFHEANNF